jgi:hypothetical protein
MSQTPIQRSARRCATVAGAALTVVALFAGSAGATRPQPAEAAAHAAKANSISLALPATIAPDVTFTWTLSGYSNLKHGRVGIFLTRFYACGRSLSEYQIFSVSRLKKKGPFSFSQTEDFNPDGGPVWLCASMGRGLPHPHTLARVAYKFTLGAPNVASTVQRVAW